jgi:hypothetical protein
VTGPEADNPYFEANNDQIQPTGLGTWIKLRTNDHEDVRGVADGSIYLSDRGWLELCWIGDKESLLNSCKTYYLPSGTSLQDIGLRPGTSHAWEDEVFGRIKLLIQPETENSRQK